VVVVAAMAQMIPPGGILPQRARPVRPGDGQLPLR
jgi:hypothetical protein